MRHQGHQEYGNILPYEYFHSWRKDEKHIGLEEKHDRKFQRNILHTDCDVGNHLLRIATPLLILMTHIRQTSSHPNVGKLRADIIQEIKSFEYKLTQIHYPIRTILAARYCVCTAMDETVMSQDWGVQSVWVEGSLLSFFQKETWGGQRFYDILDEAIADNRQNIDLIEFIYVLISLGFEGKFFGEDQRIFREEMRKRIFHHIRHAREKPDRNLSCCSQPLVLPEHYRRRRMILYRVFLLTSILIIVSMIFYNIRVYHAASSTVERLNELGNVSPEVTFTQVSQLSDVEKLDADSQPSGRK